MAQEAVAVTPGPDIQHEEPAIPQWHYEYVGCIIPRPRGDRQPLDVWGNAARAVLIDDPLAQGDDAAVTP